jgi:hypothetical protein
MPVPEATCRDRDCSDLIQRCLWTFGYKPICGLARTDLVDLDECPVEEAIRLGAPAITVSDYCEVSL